MMCSRCFQRAAFIRELGIRLHDVYPGCCSAALRIRPDHLQHLGRVHGGVISSLAGHAALGAAMSAASAGEVLVAPEFTFQVLRPVREDRIFCQAEVVKAGAVLIFTEARVYDGNSADGKQVARGTFTFTRA